jgi:hypothetical protein
LSSVTKITDSPTVLITSFTFLSLRGLPRLRGVVEEFVFLFFFLRLPIVASLTSVDPLFSMLIEVEVDDPLTIVASLVSANP